MSDVPEVPLADLMAKNRALFEAARGFSADLMGDQDPELTPRAVRDQHDHQAAQLAEFIELAARIQHQILRRLL